MASRDFTLDSAARDSLFEIFAAYEGLELLAGLADAESRHVAPVLVVINGALSDWLARSFQAAPPRRFGPLSVLDGGRSGPSPGGSTPSLDT